MCEWKNITRVIAGLVFLVSVEAVKAESKKKPSSMDSDQVIRLVEKAAKNVIDATWFDLSEDENAFEQVLDKDKLQDYISAVQRLGKLKKGEHRNVVVVRTTSSNASALEKEQVMTEFLEKALYSVKREVEKMAAEYPLPSDVVESTEGFDQEPEKIRFFAKKLNQQFIAARRKEKSFSNQDFWPDAYVFYLYGFAPRFLNGGVDIQLAAVYVPLNIKVYALPEKQGDKPELLATLKESDFRIFAIPLVEMSFIGIQTKKIDPKVGIGFIWDNQDVMSGASDLLGNTVGQVGLKTPFSLIYKAMKRFWKKAPAKGADPAKDLPVNPQGLAQLVNTATQIQVGAIHPLSEASRMVDHLSPHYWTLSVLWDKDSFFNFFGREPSKVDLDKKKLKKVARVEFTGVAGLFLSLGSVIKMFTGQMENVWKDIESQRKRYERVKGRQQASEPFRL